MRQGTQDPLSGQHSAFPLDDLDKTDTESRRVLDYLTAVREEAQDIIYATLRKRNQDSSLDYGPSPKVPKPEPTLHSVQLPMNLKESWDITKTLFNGILAEETKEPQDFAELYNIAFNSFESLESQHPEKCNSLATWKDYCAHQQPIPVSYVDTFRLYKYIVKWASGTPSSSFFVWAFALLLRTPTLLGGSEIAQIRELCRALKPHAPKSTLVNSFIAVTISVFKQYDLADLL